MTNPFRDYILAIADMVTPEEPPYQMPDIPLGMEREGHLCRWARTQERQKIRRKLLAMEKMP